MALSLDPEIYAIYNPPVLSLTNNPHTHPWILRIQQWGLGSLAAALLEHSGAFASLAANSLYMAEPLLDTDTSRQGLHALAAAMEDPRQRQALADVLRDLQ